MLRPFLRRWRGRMTRLATGSAGWGDLRSFSPLDAYDGARRGQPIDRYYIDEFLARWSADVRGVVLETGHSEYSRRFGGGRVTRSEVLHAVAGNRRATIVGDLARGGTLPPATFDCIVLTQTLQYVESPADALRACRDALAPGGSLLLSAPSLSRLSDVDRAETGEYWRFTADSITALMASLFGRERVLVEAPGNLVAATAFLHGIAAEELSEDELRHRDPRYALVVLARGVRA